MGAEIGRDAVFAEIEYEYNPAAEPRKLPAAPVIAPVAPDAPAMAESARGVPAVQNIELHYAPAPIGTPAAPIGRRLADPARERFYGMRSLAAGDRRAFDEAYIFYRQAKYMEDFTDDYEGAAQFSMYYPEYRHLGFEQFRTYFSWRTKIRRGETPPASASYLFLYIYELLSCVGVSGPAESLDKLMAIWESGQGRDRAISAHLIRWLKDFHIYYELPHSFLDFVYSYNLHEYYPGLNSNDGGEENSLTFWNRISGYNIVNSRFYKAGNEAGLNACFDYVYDGIRALFEKNNVKIEKFFSYGVNARFHWRPFQRAVFYNWLLQPDRVVELPGGETYFCKGGRWTVDASVHDAARKDLIGYTLKKMEACLRKAVNYRHLLSVNPGRISNDFRKLGVPFSKFNKAIEQSVADYIKSTTRTVVTVDQDNLARIRMEALGTQGRLLVSDDSESVTEPAPVPVPPASAAGGWNAFFDALDDTERGAVSLIVSGGAQLKAFADRRGVMLEVLLDGINEKAADHIGDNILDVGDGVIIYDEYKDALTGYIGEGGV